MYRMCLVRRLPAIPSRGLHGVLASYMTLYDLALQAPLLPEHAALRQLDTGLQLLVPSVRPGQVDSRAIQAGVQAGLPALAVRLRSTAWGAEPNRGAAVIMATTMRRNTMRAAILATAILIPAAAYAQNPAPGTGGGGPVGPSISAPTTPTGSPPPGTPSGETTGDRALRDAAGQGVIGKTETPPSVVPGDTRAPDAGVRR